MNAPEPGKSPRKRSATHITSSATLLAAVPRLLTFQPRDSLVIVGTDRPQGRVLATLRYDLPDPPDAELSVQIAEHAIGVLSARCIETASVVGYGADERVTSLAEALLEQAPEYGISINELLRVEGQRYWTSIRDPSMEWCPTGGVPLAAESRPAEAQVLSSREELAASLAPIGGDAGELMHEATRAAEEHAARLTARAARLSGEETAARLLIADVGDKAVAKAVASYRNGDSIPAGNFLAWLSVLLRDLRVRDGAWALMDPQYKKLHLRLWTDLTRLARPGYIAPAASLLAFVAWQTGNGALANIALDRALSDNPAYSMAQLLRHALDSGAPPSMARPPMTLQEVAAAYEESDDDEFDRDDSDNVSTAEPDPGNNDEAEAMMNDGWAIMAVELAALGEHKLADSMLGFWVPSGHP
jgi:hypothetical protein